MSEAYFRPRSKEARKILEEAQKIAEQRLKARLGQV
jgi:division protein CdvB (Snf7/Vps24/ESCRT-III family)